MAYPQGATARALYEVERMTPEEGDRLCRDVLTLLRRLRDDCDGVSAPDPPPSTFGLPDEVLFARVPEWKGGRSWD